LNNQFLGIPYPLEDQVFLNNVFVHILKLNLVFLVKVVYLDTSVYPPLKYSNTGFCLSSPFNKALI